MTEPSRSTPASGTDPHWSPLGVAGAAKEYWWVPAIAGGISVLAGIIVLAAPKSSLETIAIVLGIYLVVIGCEGIARAIADPTVFGGHRTLAVVMGAVAFVAGIIAIIRPDSTVKFVAVVFGIYLIISGLRFLALSVVDVPGRWVLAVHGFLELIAGIIVVVWPKIGLATLAVILGIYLLLAGFIEIWVGFAVRRAARELGA
jgi:uncharacterized membrane protein HdeD (DUF308 family)